MPTAQHARMAAAVSHSMVARQRSRIGPRREQNPSAPRSSGAVWKGVRNTCAASQHRVPAAAERRRTELRRWPG